MPHARAIDHIVVATRDLDGLAARYEALGFTLTPRASHEDRMGTANRLAQFEGRNFIELLEVDRPDTQAAHDMNANPPVYAFGWAARRFLDHREGMSALVATSGDARDDIVDWKAAGLTTYAPFDFGRKATLPDGTETEVGFSLAFASTPRAPDLTFFACQNRFPENFWKPAFQSHANGARAIATIHMVAERPAGLSGFLTGYLGGAAREEDDVLVVTGANGCEVQVRTPAGTSEIDPTAPVDLTHGALFAGIDLAGKSEGLTPASEAGGLFIRWIKN